MHPRVALPGTVLLLAFTGFSAGCGRNADPDGAAAGAEAASIAEFEAVVGLVEGPPEYLFGDVRSVAADARGRMYVADRLGSTLRVYAPDGSFIRQLGREGQGPGEYEWPADLTFGPDGRLYVRDGSRITVLAPREPGDVPDAVAATMTIPGYANLDSRRSRVDSAGRYYYPASVSRRGEVPRHFYLVYENGVHGGDTVHVPPYRTLSATGSAFYMTSGGGGRMVPGLARAPFEPVAAWDLTARGTVVGGDGAAPTLVETDARGDTAAALAVRAGPDRVPAAEHEDSARAVQVRIDSLPVPLSQVQRVSPAVLAGELPRTLPAFRSVHVGTDGSVWVERWPPEGEADRRFFDVLAPDGTQRGSVVVPAPLLTDPPPYFTATSIYGIVRDADTDVQQVVHFRFELGRGAGG